MKFIPKFLLILIFLIIEVNSLYFFISEEIEKCVFDDIPKNQIVIAHFELMDIPVGTNPERGVKVNVYDPKLKIIQTKKTKGGKEKLSFTTQEGGHHKICMSMNSDGLSSEPRKSRFSFKLIVGEEETKYDEAAKNDHISQLFSQSKRLLDKTRQFISVQELNRENEDNLYEENTKINERVFLATIFQTIVYFCIRNFSNI